MSIHQTLVATQHTVPHYVYFLVYPRTQASETKTSYAETLHKTTK